MKLQWIALAWFAGAGSADAQTVERVNVDSTGAEANQFNDSPVSISADGRFAAFASSASNLVAGDINNFPDVFVHDRRTGATERVSVDSSGASENYSSFWPCISADGRFVAFSSGASNLVAGDTNGANDVFVHDRLTGTTERVSVDSAGAQANDNSTAYSISSDGRFVAFWSRASNLVPGDTNGYADCFVHDRQTGATERVSVGMLGQQANHESAAPALSADGRFVVFGSRASNLVPGDTNGVWDIFVRDRLNGRTLRVSVDSNGAEGDLGSYGSGDPHACPSISADGRYVAFVSNATNLVPGDTNGVLDIFVHDCLGGTTERASVDSSGLEADRNSTSAKISADGRYVAFDSIATNLVAGDTNGFGDVFVHDRLSGRTERVSVSSLGTQGNYNSEIPSLSADGRLVAFGSWASTLVLGDTNGVPDLFVCDRGAPSFVSFCAPSQANVIACPCSNPPSGAGRGCDNSSATGGASLGGSGNASLAADTFVLAAAGETPSATSIVIQGTDPSYTGLVFGQGVRCVGGTLKRLYVKTASGGSIQAPSGADPSLSARSAALGDAILAGQQRYYMVQYRDPIVLGVCSSTSTFNATAALDVPWSP